MILIDLQSHTMHSWRSYNNAWPQCRWKGWRISLSIQFPPETSCLRRHNAL